MRITSEQKETLDSLIIERLSKSADNAALTKTFRNDKNPHLVHKLQAQSTFDKDLSGATTYYLVKAPTGELLMYFSLKCGELFVGLDFKKMDLARNTRDALMMLDRDPNSQEYVNALTFLQNNIEEIKAAWQNVDTFLADVDALIAKKDAYIKEIQKEINADMQQVWRTYPAVEIVEFCANDNARDIWKSLKLPDSKKMGECVFWNSIVPKLQEVQDLVGCQYVYLFAADSSADEFLVNYYKNKLKFEQPLTINANKPRYDFQCTFLCRELNALIKGKDDFFNDFNPDNIDNMV